MLKRILSKILTFLLVFTIAFSNFPLNTITDYLSERNIVDNVYWASKVSNVVDNFGVKNAYAADGSGTNIVFPASAVSGSTGNTFNFTFTAAETMNSGVFRIAVPAGWSAPQLNSGTAGYTTAASSFGMVADVLTTADALAGSNGAWLEDDADACNSVNIRTSTTIFKEGTASIECNNAASAAADNSDSFAYRYTATSNWSSYTRMAAWVYVTKAMNATNYIRLAYDDTSGMTTPLQALNLTAIPASTWTYVTMDLTAARTAVKEFGIVCVNAGCDNDVIYVDYFLVGPGKPIITGTGPWGINVALMNLTAGQTVNVAYGAGGGASGVTAPIVGADTPYTFTTASRISTGGTFTNIATSPVITVTAPTGPNATGFSNNTEALADGGRSGQEITVTGTGFGSGPSDGTNNAVKIGTYTVPNGNVAVWNSTTITFTIPAAATVYGGTGTNGLIIRAGGIDDTTPLDFYIYPNIISTSSNSAQIGDDTFVISGNHFGVSVGTVTVVNKTATVVGGWSETSLTVQIPGQQGIGVTSGKIQITRSDTKTSNQYPTDPSNFTILAPSVNSSSPASSTTGQASVLITFNGYGIDTDFGTEPTLLLRKSGQNDIPAKVGTYGATTNYQQVYAQFDLVDPISLADAATGYWKLIIINMDGQSGSYGDEINTGFNIIAPAPIVSSINPSSGINSGATSNISIGGSNFQSDATVQLTKTAQLPIDPSINFTYVDPSNLVGGAFNLTDKPTGWWNVVVTNIAAGTSGSYGNEIDAGFRIMSAAPFDPTSLSQSKTQGGVSVAVGEGIGGQTTIYFRMDMSGGKTGENYFPQVEVKPTTASFECPADVSTCTVTSGFFAEHPTGFLYNGGAPISGWVSVNVGAANEGVGYHWQARVKNSAGVSAWISFGGNAESSSDVYVDATAPTISPGTSGNCDTAAINISDLAADIQWNTYDDASGASSVFPGPGTYAKEQVDYKKGADPWSSTTLSSWKNSLHQVHLSGLSPATNYTFRMRSQDYVGNEKISAECNFTTTSSRPIKTVEFFIGQEIAQNIGGQVVFPFTITIPESPSPSNLSVKSAFIEITGISSSSVAIKDINVELRRDPPATYTDPGTNFKIDSSGTTTPFTILFDALLPPGGAGNGQEDMTNIITGATPYSYKLFLSGGTVAEPISVFSAKLIITYSYEL